MRSARGAYAVGLALMGAWAVGCRSTNASEDAPTLPPAVSDEAVAAAEPDPGIDAEELLREALASGEAATRTSVPSAEAIGVLTTQLAAAHADDAVEALSEACGLGDAEACLVAGARQSDGTAEGFGGMLDHWQMSCAQGHAEACGWLVAALARAGGLAHAPARLEAPCARGSLAACAALGWALRETPEAARELLRPACDAERGDACLYLASVESEASARRSAFARACAAGEPRGCLGVGLLDLAAGDVDEAERALQAGCRDGVAEGCAVVGALLWRDGDEASREERRRLLRAACESEHAAACHALAADPVDEDDRLDRLAAATPWFVAACTLGRGSACHAFAEALRSIEVEDGASEVLDELTRRACVDGVQAACELLETEAQRR